MTERVVHLRKCQIDGEIIYTSADFHWHGIKHSDPYEVTEEEFKRIARERREATTMNEQQTRRAVLSYSKAMGVAPWPTVYFAYKPSRWNWWACTFHNPNPGGTSYIQFGPGFFRITRRGQVGVIIHELLHLLHPPAVTIQADGHRVRENVHSGPWKEAALLWSRMVLRVQREDMLPEWRNHPYASTPNWTPPRACARCGDKQPASITPKAIVDALTGRETRVGLDLRVRCWCGRFLTGDAKLETWTCEGCKLEEDDCECGQI